MNEYEKKAIGRLHVMRSYCRQLIAQYGQEACLNDILYTIDGQLKTIEEEGAWKS